MALIDRNLIDSPYLDKISSTAAFRLNSVVPNIAQTAEYNIQIRTL